MLDNLLDLIRVQTCVLTGGTEGIGGGPPRGEYVYSEG